MTFTTQDQLFKWIWKHRPHYSEISGSPLGDEPSPYYFAHNLAKGPYPKFKFRPCNIVLMTAAEHIIFDQMTHKAKEIPAFNWVFLQRSILKAQYYAV